MHQIRQEPEDITIEFYWKVGMYVSEITGCQTIINIKKVERYTDDFGSFYNLITTTNGVQYYESELTFSF